ncbi:MAG: hypothetical protein M1827_003385 [Pycnora praestabilis]|nr:MAG: hypothetical protein M1827_003385 [Pycnora praestabilis]
MDSYPRLRSVTLTQTLNLLTRALVLWILAIVVFRHYWLESQDPFHCGALLNQGRWLDSYHCVGARRPLQNWQPPGCMMHEYNAKDISSCLNSKRIAFVGDSTTRQVYWAMAKKLDRVSAETEMLKADKHADLEFNRGGIELTFIWDPFLNSSALQRELIAHRDDAKVFQDDRQATKARKDRKDAAALTLVGAGLWHARHLHHSPIKIYKDAVDSIISYTSRKSIDLTSNTKPLLFLAPVQVPYYELLSPSRLITITPEKIEQMNDHLQQLSAFQGVHVLWSYYLMTSQGKSVYEESGLHVVESVAEEKADVLLNLKCNAEAARSDGYPYDRTCCSNYGAPGWIQWIWIIGTMGVLLGFRWFGTTDPGSEQCASNQPLLSRDQTDEWKGWMQLIILVYHYTGASKILWIYEIVRLLVAAYLFMSGFGHTVFFYKKSDYSLRRFAATLVRLNLLSCVLPYIMRTDYLFYYFAPLVSFWFVVIYLTMRIGSIRNGSLPFLISKIVFSALVVTGFTKTHGLLEAVFMILKYTCKIHWNVDEWRFRVYLDMYIVYIGMIAAVAYVRLSSGLALSQYPRKQKSLIDGIHDNMRYVQPALAMMAVIILLAFWQVTRRSPDKYDYNWWQPYISCFPILSFIILRNSHRHLRNYHSSIFAWIGRCSLETFTLQFHVWLAGDTKGLLGLGVYGKNTFSGREKDFILLTLIFFWISWRVADATTTLTSWIVDGGEAMNGKAEVGEAKQTRSSRELPTIMTQFDRNGQVQRIRSGNGVVGGKMARDMVVGWQFIKNIWKKDLRIRIGILLATMWFANMILTTFLILGWARCATTFIPSSLPTKSRHEGNDLVLNYRLGDDDEE